MSNTQTHEIIKTDMYGFKITISNPEELLSKFDKLDSYLGNPALYELDHNPGLSTSSRSTITAFYEDFSDLVKVAYSILNGENKIKNQDNHIDVTKGYKLVKENDSSKYLVDSFDSSSYLRLM